MEKNMAPKWMEGQYVLTVKGDKVTIESPTGPFGQMTKYEARCHPDDEFTIVNGVAEAFMKKFDDTVKIKVGDKVRVVDLGKVYSTYADWVDENVHGVAKCMYQYDCTKPDTTAKHKVLVIGEHPVTFDTLMYIQEIGYDDDGYGKCYLLDVKGLEKVVD